MATEEMATHKQIALVFKQTNKKKNQPPKLVETLNDFLKYALSLSGCRSPHLITTLTS